MEGSRPYVVAIDPDARVVEAWSTKRLPLEPKGWLLDLRAELRSALALLRSGTGRVLSALYGSPVAGVCDAESVLIYNVGASHLGAAAGSGLRVERSYDCPSPPLPLNAKAEHYWRYRASPVGEGFCAWREGRAVADWSRVAMPPLTEMTRPAAIWYAMRIAPVAVSSIVDPGKPFGLRITLGVAAGEPAAPARIVKPLVDGVIAALHSHDGTALTEVSERVQLQTPTASPGRIAALLVGERSAALGRRRLLWRRASGVQWNPAGDRCIALELRVERRDRRELSGRLVELEAQ